MSSRCPVGKIPNLNFSPVPILPVSEDVCYCGVFLFYKIWIYTAGNIKRWSNSIGSFEILLNFLLYDSVKYSLGHPCCCCRTLAKKCPPYFDQDFIFIYDDIGHSS